MNNKRYVVLRATMLLSLCLMLGTCSDGINYDYLSLTPRSFGVAANGVLVEEASLTFDGDQAGMQKITVKSQNASWAVENPAEWVKVSPTSGSSTTEIAVSVEPNPTTDSRIAVLRVVSKETELPLAYDISVTQHGATQYITPSETEIAVSGSKTTKDVTVSSNLPEWVAIVSDGWIKVARESGKVRISVDENTGPERIGYVTVGKAETRASIKVTQHEADAKLMTSLSMYNVDGGTQTLKFNADATWRAGSTYSWIDIKQKSGSAGENTMAVEVARNTSTSKRSGSVYIYIGNAEKLRVDVSQDGVNVSVSPVEIDFTSDGGKETFQVQANTAWVARPSESWVSLSPKQGNAGETTVEISVQDVGSSEPRSAKVDICLPDGTTPLSTVSVSQEGWIDPLVTLPDFPATGSTQSVDVATTGKWTASASKSWIHLSPASGTGNGRLNITVDENPDTDLRKGVVKVTLGSVEKGININQIGRYVNISCDEAVKASTPCSVKVVVGANASWTADADVKWITVSPTSGEGNANLTVTFADNPSQNPRTGNVIVKSSNETKSLSFTQPGKHLTLSESSVSFFAAGGTSDPITVSTDGTAECKVGDSSWLSATLKDGRLTITAKENTNKSIRTSTVTVSLAGLTDAQPLSHTVTVTQAQASDIEPSMTQVDMPGAGGSETITITANCTWSVTSSASWLTATKKSNTELTLTASENTASTERTAAVSIMDEIGTVKSVISVNQQIIYDIIDGHAYVDLGLPSGLLWATCNVGANNPEDYGNYYAWGETEIKPEYEPGNSTTHGKTTDQLISAGIIGSDGNLTSAYDAATNAWGGTWRMPTLDEIKELRDNTTTKWTTQNGVNGRKVTSKTNGNSIFLPAAGYRDRTSLYSAGSHGDFWSSSPNVGSSSDAYLLFFISSNFDWTYELRYSGLSVRPVSGSVVIIPAKTAVLFSANGNTETIGIEANCTWSATSSASWLTCTKKSNSELTLTAAAITSDTERTATVSIKDEKGAVKATISVKQKSNKINGHEYVDLGLPSGLLWATCNVGASKAEDYGNYYAWGETSTKSSYSNSTSTTYGKTIEQLTTAGIIGSDGNLTAAYDAATKAWGGTWRMPTFDEIKELINNTTTTWTTQNGVNGRKVTSKTNGNFIFLPAAGYSNGTSLGDAGSRGRYWSSSPITSFSYYAYYLYFYSSNFDWNSYDRYAGQSVRPVSAP